MKLPVPLLSLAFALSGTSGPAPACGPFFKATLLDTWQGGKVVLAPPVADWIAELQSLKGAPQRPEDGALKKAAGDPVLPAGLTVSEEGLPAAAWEVLQRDLSDLGQALGDAPGRLKILTAYAMARRSGLLCLPERLDDRPTGPVAAPVWPDGLPAEFLLYAKGAQLFHEGKRPEARAQWEALLKVPPNERPWRGTWAAWMLARTSFPADPAAAIAAFRQIRQEAPSGNDSLNRAAASFGWEALATEKSMATEARAFSVPLAERLVWLLIRHAAAGGGEPYFLSGRHDATGQQLALHRIGELTGQWLADPARAAAMAGSPWLRQVVTISLLPISRGVVRAMDPDTKDFRSPSTSQWLAALAKSDAAGRDDFADRLAWAAYEAADYPSAAAWLKRSPDSSMAEWLRAKIALQEGRVKDAAAHLNKAAPDFAISGPMEDRHEDSGGYPEDASALQREQFQADLGLVRLALDDFPGSLDALSRSGFHEDAAYVLENLTTQEEVIKYAVKWPLEARFKGKPGPLPSALTITSLEEWLNPPDPGTAPEAAEPAAPDDSSQNYAGSGKLHETIARRLAREDNTKVSREFLPLNLRPLLDLFLKHRAIGQDKSKPAPVRAMGYWRAALIHRYFGMELWGYEGYPDNTSKGGSFEAENLRSYRLGTLKVPDWEKEGALGDPPVIFPAVSPAEKTRLAATAPRPGKRFNYRYRAYSMAGQAFALMPQNTEELAQMINLTGWWFAKFDEEATRKALAELQSRCPATDLAKKAKLNDWVIPMGQEIEAQLKRLE